MASRFSSSIANDAPAVVRIKDIMEPTPTLSPPADHDVVDHCAAIVAGPRSSPSQSHITNNHHHKPIPAKRTLHLNNNGAAKTKTAADNSKPTPDSVQSPTQVATLPVVPQRRKSSFPTLEKLPLFQQFRKRGASAPAIHSITPTVRKDRPAFVKSSSIARLFGNTYSTSAAAANKEQQLAEANAATKTAETATSSSSSSAPPPPTVERFHACTDDDHNHLLGDSVDMAPVHRLYGDDFDVAVNPFRSLSRGLGRLFFKKSYSVKISDPDPEFKVAYLGNVLTGWAKGESCMEKPLATLWRNYTQNSKPDVSMRVKICPSGLKAVTRQHGLTEYWSHRITFCSSPRNYPKVFCWIYRHEGRKLKHELRCHAVLCTKESVAESVAKMLQDNLSRALREFKRDKINKQNARLSLVNSVYENPSMPQRKIMLSVGGNNYRPPLERSKSAPRLMVIEEQGEEPDDADTDGDVTEARGGRGAAAARPACCTVDPLYPAMTLGRRKCRRGHSIRRTGNRHQLAVQRVRTKVTTSCGGGAGGERVRFSDEVAVVSASSAPCEATHSTAVADEQPGDRLRDSGDDLDKLLLGSNYDTESPLANELLSYFDMKFKNNTSMSGGDGGDGVGNGRSMIDLHRTHVDDDDEVDLRVHGRRFESVVRTSLSLDNLDSYCDDDGDYDDEGEEEDDEEGRPVNGSHAMYFSQADILTTLNRLSSSHHQHQDSGYAAATNADSEDVAIESTPSTADVDDDIVSSSSTSSTKAPVARSGPRNAAHQLLLHQHTATSSFDSDEGSISSGFETVSTVTANGADGTTTTKSDGETETANSLEECSSVRTTPLAQCKQPTVGRSFSHQRHAAGGDSFSDDSEQSDVSDESGYVEYQRLAKSTTTVAAVATTTPTNSPSATAVPVNGSG